ncbi:hypothetical protein B0H17DRAFT_1125073 [Mycena rosella]|uniref:Uncharacterized protein n=1 Tax=Mycena rosella TaxID=1033263 RepID=A0AAD7GYV6_MYCRO|nr:hypothetical protein B0H17DRAFT_1125073 [Mycena rosella]
MNQEKAAQSEEDRKALSEQMPSPTTDTAAHRKLNTAGERSPSHGILELQPFQATGHEFSFRLTCGWFVVEMLVPGTGSQIHNIPDWNCWLCVSRRDLPELELVQGKERNLTINFKCLPLLADRSINIATDEVAIDQ